MWAHVGRLRSVTPLGSKTMYLSRAQRTKRSMTMYYNTDSEALPLPDFGIVVELAIIQVLGWSTQCISWDSVE